MVSICVVDDEPIIGIGLQALIREYNRFERIIAFTDSEAALAHMIAEPLTVLLTDIRMPRLDGLELCRIMHERKLPTQVVVLSGYGDFAYARKCLSYGVKEYLLKPVTEIELYPALDKVLAEAEEPKVISFSRFELWIERLEEAVWGLDHAGADELLRQGEADFFAGGTAEQLRQSVLDGIALLAKKLNAHGVNKFASGLAEAQTAPPIGCAQFRAEVRRWMADLAEQRCGERIGVLETALQYIDDHLFQDDVTLDKVAEKLGLTPTYFSHYFKKKTNETFVQYRLRKRIERAKHLLAIPHYKIIDIVSDIGYDSYPHFSRVFKRETGYSPTEYRALLGIR